MKASELKPCPLCGGEVKLETGLYLPPEFRCLACGIVLRPKLKVASRENAIAAWNRHAVEGAGDGK